MSQMPDLAALRVYEPHECGKDRYPHAWHDLGHGYGVKHMIRDLAGRRCVRCLHPYTKGLGGASPCDERCRHAPPSEWRILTVHHLRLGHDAKRDLRWWNLAALCQRCHLQIQGKVQMERVWPHEHSEWFKPYAAGWYAWSYLGLELTREQTAERLDELLALELAA
jgi:hypothetical protein